MVVVLLFVACILSFATCNARVSSATTTVLMFKDLSMRCEVSPMRLSSSAAAASSSLRSNSQLGREGPASSLYGDLIRAVEFDRSMYRCVYYFEETDLPKSLDLDRKKTIKAVTLFTTTTAATRENESEPLLPLLAAARDQEEPEKEQEEKKQKEQEVDSRYLTLVCDVSLEKEEEEKSSAGVWLPVEKSCTLDHVLYYDGPITLRTPVPFYAARSSSLFPSFFSADSPADKNAGAPIHLRLGTRLLAWLEGFFLPSSHPSASHWDW
jgi:hypothetical protein